MQAEYRIESSCIVLSFQETYFIQKLSASSILEVVVLVRLCRFELITPDCFEASSMKIVSQLSGCCIHWLSTHSMAFSASIIALTPLYMSWTRSFSERPRRLLFEISQVPSELSECSPWIPRIWTWYQAAISSNFFMSLESFGSLMWTEALSAVPRLVGQDVMYPK